MKLRMVLLASALLNAQSSPKRPEFEVASIKPNDSGGGNSSMGSQGPGRFDTKNVSLRTIIAEAYNFRNFQIYGAPGWLASDKYDIAAKSEEPASKLSADEAWAEMRLKVQTLLEDRCALKVHRETKELPVYVLTVAKNGIKVKTTDCIVFDINNRPPPPAPGQPRPMFCDNLRGGRNGANSTLTATGIPMSQLVRWLSSTVGRTVIDKTGYSEKFDAVMQWTPDGPPRQVTGDDSSKTASDDTVGPSIFTALQEQLGLKLESGKGPVEVLVIDHVERPSGN